MSRTPRRKPGKLGPHVEGYREWLAQQGYTPGTVRGMLKDLGQVVVWMAQEDLRRAARRGGDGGFLAVSRTAGRRKVPVGTRDGTVAELPAGPAATTMLRYANITRRLLAQQAMACRCPEPAG